MTTAAPPLTGRAVLGELSALLGRYPDMDCPPDAIQELLDELSGVLRRARAAVRRQSREPREPVDQPPRDQPAPVPTQPPREPEKPAAAEVPAASPGPQPQPEPHNPASGPAAAPAVTPDGGRHRRPDGDTRPRPAAAPTAVLDAIAVRARRRRPLLVGLIIAAVAALLALLTGDPAAIAGVLLLPVLFRGVAHAVTRPKTTGRSYAAARARR